MTWSRERPLDAGLSRGVVDSEYTLVTKNEWNHMAAIRAVVGQCRVCAHAGRQGDLVPIEASEHDAQGEDGRITWYETRCRTCGREEGSPNGRVLARSALHSEMPSGWLEERDARDAEEAQRRAGGK